MTTRFVSLPRSTGALSQRPSPSVSLAKRSTRPESSRLQHLSCLPFFFPSSSSSSTSPAAASASAAVAAAAASAAAPSPSPLPSPSPSPAPVAPDYVAAATDAPVLRLPPKTELTPEEITHVFGYPRDFHDVYELGEVLGAGSFGVVRACRRRDGKGPPAAVKTIPKVPRRGSATPRHLLKLRSEADVMRQLGPSLDAVSLFDAYEDDACVHLVTELCSGGSVLEAARSGGGLSEARVADVARSILRFLAQCHAKGIVFRDVKPDNFLFLYPIDLFDDDGDGDDSSSGAPPSPVRATDFGLAIRHSPSDPPLTSRTGTPVYMAPEVITQSYGAPADCWSAGMVIYQLLTGSLVFWDSVVGASLQDVWGAILHQEIDLDNPESGSAAELLPEGARSLLKGLLERDPAKRTTAAEALSHPWLSAAGAGVGVGTDNSSSQCPSLSRAAPGGDVVQRLQRFATHGRLKRVILTLIADELNRDAAEFTSDELPLPSLSAAAASVASASALFAALDKDGSGGVCMSELGSGLSAAGYDLSPPEVEKLMARLDVDGDGCVDKGELLAALVDWQRLQGVGVDDATCAADYGSGVGSSSVGSRSSSLSSPSPALATAVTATAPTTTAAATARTGGGGGCEAARARWRDWVSAAFDRLDADGSGCIDLAELAALVRSQQQQQGSNSSSSSANNALREAAELLREADADGDGRLSREEFEALLTEGGGAGDDTLSLYDSRRRRVPSSGLRAMDGDDDGAAAAAAAAAAA